MGLKSTLRAIEAAQRRQQRESQKRLRELERQAREEAKLSAMEKARLEVETIENRLELLLSVHKEQGESWDWTSLAASLPPPCPQKSSRNEYRARQQTAVFLTRRDAATALVEQAKVQDEGEFQNATKLYAEQIEEWDKLKNLARRIVAGEHKAFTETLVEVNPFAEISDLGSAIHFTVHTPKLVEFSLAVDGKRAIPPEVKTLTAAGKLSVKAMPKGRFHEIYQDYLCGCVLRIARELFALFPIATVLATAVVKSRDQQTGRRGELPVLSAAIQRAVIERLNFDQVGAFDAMDNFPHRGDLKASRKSETFEPIVPLTPDDIAPRSAEDMAFSELRDRIKALGKECSAKISELSQTSDLLPSQPLP
jgi:hypothetical protein